MGMVIGTEENASSDFDMTSSEGTKDFEEMMERMMSLVVTKVDGIPFLRQRMVDACKMAIDMGLF